MATIIEMPKLSDTMTEGKILSWLKNEGEAVEPGDALAEIESDKSNMELEAYDPGYVRKHLVEPGSSCPVGAPIAIVTESPDEDIAVALAEAQSQTVNEAVETKPESAPAPETVAVPEPTPPATATSPTPTAGAVPLVPPTASAPAPGAPTRENGGRVLASPLALRMASEYGLNLRDVVGTGPDGRVVKRDIEKALTDVRSRESATSTAVASTAPPPFQPIALEQLPTQSVEEVAVSSMRRVIAERLTESKNTAPHFYLTMEIDMKHAVRARKYLNSMDGIKVSFNDIVVKASSLALTRHPGLNASWHGDAIRYYKSIDIGIAVALPDGLVTPIVRACHLKGLGRISQEIKDLAAKAKDKKLVPSDYQGSTFTISNLGMFGVNNFTAIINPPEACILSVSAIREVPVVQNGEVVPGLRMHCTLSCDHRIVDGAQAAHFMKDLKAVLENPVSLAL